jgi:hypothetical protein
VDLQFAIAQKATPQRIGNLTEFHKTGNHQRTKVAGEALRDIEVMRIRAAWVRLPIARPGLACGLLLKALQNGYRCQFIRAQDLCDEMYASLADRSTRQLLNRLARLDVLLIDGPGGPPYLSYDGRSGQTAVVSHRHVRIYLSRLSRARAIRRSADADQHGVLHRSRLHLQ